jgi:hypothetical protein
MPLEMLLRPFFAILLLAAAPMTTTPTTTTAPIAADPSSPKGALHALAEALAAGDRQAILDRLFAEADQDKRLAGATADLAEATAALRRAAIKTFGEAAAAPLGGDLTASPQALKRIDAARVETGAAADKAIVRPADSDGPPLILVQREGTWKIPVAELSKDVESADVQKSIDAMNAQTKQMKAIAADITAGKFKTAVDARQELDQRILKVSMPKGKTGDADQKPQ